ncbi:Nuclear transcription factor Y subunit gamma [Bagarius yarrelli]|uniref:Nuclear transcription factor Y subunit gamma n=2 Tax=Otophysi TaxID=186626 RepID=A0A556TPH5_BAGYA|nr:Nuclear transcription factor Y subunit gamma [Bagarius yarrelli]
MADLLTVYDDGEANSFIECKICDKRIRGDTNHKIHLTTLQHHKPTPLPHWTNIKEYLLYLNLNEPIIGLSTLVQEEDSVSSDGTTLLRYRCRLCAVQMDLSDMATHVVGRKHRQKYLERYRPELVTWENNSEKQAGVVARAKAAIVEKQEGWGNPVPLRFEKGRSGRNQAPQSRSSNVRGKAPTGHDRSRQNSYNHSRMDSDTNRRPSRYHEDNQYNQSYRDDVPNHPSGSRDNRYDKPYCQDGRQRRSYEERDYMERPYWEEKQNRGSFSSERSPDRQAYMDKREPQPYDDEWYQKENPSKGPYKNREDDDYYHANISENGYGDPGMDYQESERMQDPVYSSHHGAGASMDDRQWQGRNLPYAEREREHFQDQDGTGRRGSFEMHDFNKRQSYYPTEEELPAKRQKKSRFSDPSPLDIAMPKTSHDTSSKPKRAVPYMQNQASGSNIDLAVTPRMENVLDVLNDIQINNVEEANFLKDKLHSLLKEFQSNKAQRNQGQGQSSSDFADSYHGINNMEPPQPRRDMPQPRRMDDHGFQEPVRYSRDMQTSRDYLHTRHVEEDPGMRRQSRAPQEPEYQWNPYREGSAGRPEERMLYRPDDRRVYQEPVWNSRPLREEERGYADHHQYQRDYRSGGDPYDPFEPSSSPPLESSNPTLDKLASTLLELVARKTTVLEDEHRRHFPPRSLRRLLVASGNEWKWQETVKHAPPYWLLFSVVTPFTREFVLNRNGVSFSTIGVLRNLDWWNLVRENQKMSGDSFGAAGTDAQQNLQSFWPRVMEEIRNLTVKDFRVQELPLARIKKIMKLDEDVKMISAEAPVLFAKAAQIFITELTLRAWIHTEDNKRRTLQRNDIAMAITKFDQFDFLIDIVPRDDLKPPKRQEEVRQSVASTEPVQYYFTLAQQPGAVQVQGQQQGQQVAAPTTATTLQPGQIIIAQPQQGQVLQGTTMQQLQQVQVAQSQATPITSAPVTMQVGEGQQVQIVQAAAQGQAQAQAAQPAGQTMQVMQQIITNTGEIQQIPVQLNAGGLQYIRLAQPVSGAQVVQGQIQTLATNTQQVSQTEVQQGQQQFNQFTDGQQLYQIQQVTMPAGQELTQPMFIQSTSQTADGQVSTQDFTTLYKAWGILPLSFVWFSQKRLSWLELPRLVGHAVSCTIPNSILKP